MDRRRRQYIPLSVYVTHGKTGQRLLDRFGLEGVAVWVAFLCACKTNWVQGQFTYAGEPDGWSKLGLYAHQPDFTLEQFFAFTGRIKQTSKRRSGHVTDVVCTQWEAWSLDVQKELDAEKKRSKRQQNTETLNGQNPDDTGTLEGTEVEGEDDEETRAREPNGSLPREQLQEMGLLRMVKS